MRNPFNKITSIKKEYEPGVIRSENDLYMNGLSVMNFAIKRVPKSIKNYQKA